MLSPVALAKWQVDKKRNLVLKDESITDEVKVNSRVGNAKGCATVICLESPDCQPR
jgi:hypothetical protein